MPRRDREEIRRLFDDINPLAHDINDVTFDEVLQLLEVGKNVSAIKALRDNQGLGLKNAKSAVEDLLACWFVDIKEMH